MNFSGPQVHADPIFKALNILKLPDIVKLNNVIFVHDTLNNKSPEYFNDYFTPVRPNSRYNTTRNPRSLCSIPSGSIQLSSSSSSVKQICAVDWNEAIKYLSDVSSQTDWLKNLSRTNLKGLLWDHFLNTY